MRKAYTKEDENLIVDFYNSGDKDWLKKVCKTLDKQPQGIITKIRHMKNNSYWRAKFANDAAFKKVSPKVKVSINVEKSIPFEKSYPKNNVGGLFNGFETPKPKQILFRIVLEDDRRITVQARTIPSALELLAKELHEDIVRVERV